MAAPDVYRTIGDLRAALKPARMAGERIAMVPTMGALHDGHLSLVERARDEADRVVVSIFVNPTQFAPHEDFDAYPRNEDRDLEQLKALSVEAAFIPSVREMYPHGFATGVTVGGPSEGLESAFRPHFFDGVALVVTKLLLAAMPDVAIFGEKDYQQLCVVRRMVRDLNVPTEIIGAPTVRESDGLAMSSRNVYLSPDERKTATSLPATLREVIERLERGDDAHDVLSQARRTLEDVGFKVDYLELRDGETLGPVTEDTQSRRILVAVWLGRTRLIDNMAV
ncbi:pantoate--beta-alanine ligase [Stappia sp. GBMRC 2046]|uniref:Pantothenate synthetase n=1 Tax=Stappia sediminis TaxID=2692190 RepID=A0A7X3LS88_9HYPH|nr:pantoate--beta-alanine ligase [Stappia sediminis]MXN64136.1 pantoate--beta-alanine ligase [Stappia sediminis]